MGKGRGTGMNPHSKLARELNWAQRAKDRRRKKRKPAKVLLVAADFVPETTLIKGAPKP